MTKPAHDEFPGVEPQGITRTTLSNLGSAQFGDGRWIETEKMQSPSVWPAALDAIKECAMAVIQEEFPKVAAMAMGDKALARQRDRPRVNVASKG